MSRTRGLFLNHFWNDMEEQHLGSLYRYASNTSLDSILKKMESGINEVNSGVFDSDTLKEFSLIYKQLNELNDSELIDPNFQELGKHLGSLYIYSSKFPLEKATKELNGLLNKNGTIHSKSAVKDLSKIYEKLKSVNKTEVKDPDFALALNFFYSEHAQIIGYLLDNGPTQDVVLKDTIKPGDFNYETSITSLINRGFIKKKAYSRWVAFYSIKDKDIAESYVYEKLKRTKPI